MIRPALRDRLGWLPAAVDAIAAACCGVGVSLIAIGVKPVPGVIKGYLEPSWVTAAWALLLFLGALCACVGSAMRTTNPGRRQSVGYLLEFCGWPCIAWAAFIFALATAKAFGFIDALLTIGFTGFVIFTAISNWWSLFHARIVAGQHARKGRRGIGGAA